MEGDFGCVCGVDWIRSFGSCGCEERFLMVGVFRVEGKVEVIRRDRSGCVLFFKEELMMLNR